ncbi:hypothetical protein CCUS01_00262 [Colletotrichum cuscutae]|uniref:Uncharacterized protein n=1 Tax=Colletotrichum cuscutae TaxID=1209917 RepID=A0AAI9YE35_9PEZI|nr:hypothetical protein CCUS01_00262 [Colletotrichum cuscutae]
MPALGGWIEFLVGDSGGRRSQGHAEIVRESATLCSRWLERQGTDEYRLPQGLPCKGKVPRVWENNHMGGWVCVFKNDGTYDDYLGLRGETETEGPELESSDGAEMQLAQTRCRYGKAKAASGSLGQRGRRTDGVFACHSTQIEDSSHSRCY